MCMQSPWPCVPPPSSWGTESYSFWRRDCGMANNSLCTSVYKSSFALNCLGVSFGLQWCMYSAKYCLNGVSMEVTIVWRISERFANQWYEDARALYPCRRLPGCSGDLDPPLKLTPRNLTPPDVDPQAVLAILTPPPEVDPQELDPP